MIPLFPIIAGLIGGGAVAMSSRKKMQSGGTFDVFCSSMSVYNNADGTYDVDIEDEAGDVVQSFYYQPKREVYRLSKVFECEPQFKMRRGGEISEIDNGNLRRDLRGRLLRYDEMPEIVMSEEEELMPQGYLLDIGEESYFYYEESVRDSDAKIAQSILKENYGGKKGGSTYADGGKIVLDDGHELNRVSKDYAMKNWRKEEIYAINLQDGTERVIESKEDVEQFDTFGTEHMPRHMPLFPIITGIIAGGMSDIQTPKTYSLNGVMRGQKDTLFLILENASVDYAFNPDRNTITFRAEEVPLEDRPAVSELMRMKQKDLFFEHGGSTYAGGGKIPSSNDHFTIYDVEDDEFYGVSGVRYSEGDDILDDGHPYLVIGEPFLTFNDVKKIFKGWDLVVEKDDEFYPLSRKVYQITTDDDVLDKGHYYYEIKQGVFEQGGSTYNDGGGVGEIDLFEDYEKIPPELQQVLDKYSLEDNDYPVLEQMLKEVESVGYTFDYGLDAEPYGLRKKGTALSDLIGFEEMDSDYFDKGGSTYAGGGEANEPTLLIDSHHGQYIPKLFYENMKFSDFGLKKSDYKDLADNENEYYWDTWDMLLNEARTKDGSYLYHYEDLWLVPEGYEGDLFDY